MPCVSLDTSFPDSDQAIRLALRLQERLAWCFVVRLWCWGMDQNREDGVLRLDSKRIAEVCSWRGDPDEFVAALVEVELLVKQDGDDTYYMAGWSRNKEFFAKKNRMRDYRERKKAARRAARETPQETSRDTSPVTSPETSQETPSRSPSRSRSRSLRSTRSGAERSAAPPHPPAVADEVRHTASVSPTASEDTSPEVLRIPLLAGEEFVVTEALVAEWERAYPAVAIEQELRALREWALSNPTKRKRNGRAFCTRNLARKQEEGGSRRKGINGNSGGIRDRTRDENGEPLPTYMLPVKFDADGNPYQPDVTGPR